MFDTANMTSSTESRLAARKRVGVLAYPGCMASQVFGITDILLICRHIARVLGHDDASACDIDVIAPTARKVRLAGGHDCMAKAPDGPYELLIVPGLPATDPQDMLAQLARLKAEVRFIRTCSDQGCRIASICLGAFLLGEAGLVSGRRISTAWTFAETFAQRYPMAIDQSHQLLVDDEAIISTGAVSSVFDLAMYLGARIFGDEVARLAGDVTLLDAPRQSQLPYVNEKLLLSLTPRFSREVLGWINQHLNEPIDLAQLAAAFHISERTLIRRTKAETGKTPLALVQQQRIGCAKTMLTQTRHSLQHIVEAVGYTDLPTFSRLFQRHVGETPASYRRRHAVKLGTARLVDQTKA